MILVKVIIGMTILIALYSVPIPKSLNHSIQDDHLKSQAYMTDAALISYYRFHGEYPDKLNANTLRIMGLDGIDISKFTYVKNNDTYTLSAKLSTGQYVSPHSNIKIQ